MSRRQRVLVVLGPVAFALMTAAACSFPDLAYNDGTTDGAPPPTDSPTSDSPVTPEASTDASDRDHAADPEGAPPIDATSEKPPVGDCTSHPCDCDQDEGGTKDASAPSACMLADASLHPNSDCDDLDNRAFVGQGYLDDLPTLDTKGDWNCDGTVDRYYGVNLNCSALGACPIIGSAPTGFLIDPECGQSAAFFTCANGAGGCQPLKIDDRKQACR